jgi:hypothetical protein
LLCTSFCFSQTIDEGLWYHQQPTLVNDSGQFFGGKKTFEGFCGIAAVGMALQYFIPNIHSILYEKYGEVKFHDDKRGGLKSSDPYCYNPSSTYTFEDFLGHKYIGRHITETGCSYRELDSLIKSLDKDIDSYSAQISWVDRDHMRDYLDKGYLIVLNTKQGGGHYILIGGWDGNPADSVKSYYYVWDSWKVPLDIDSTQYTFTTNLVGNRFNPGSAKNILCYKIPTAVLNSIFRDQFGNGTMLAFKFSPKNEPPKVSTLSAKGIWVPYSIIESEGYKTFIDSVSKHGITDLFILVKGTDGNVSLKTLKNIIPLAHKKSIKVNAWVVTLYDKDVTHLTKYSIVENNWIDANDKAYKNFILKQVIGPLCRLKIDGITLDYLKYPESAKKYDGSEEGIIEYYKDIRSYMDKHGKKSILLGATVMPDEKAAINCGQNISELTNYVNFIIPTLYTHNYLKAPEWVGTQLNNLKNSVAPGYNIWTGIQSLDDNGNYTTPLEIRQCIEYASANNSTCITLFRYPLAGWQWKLLDQYKIINNNKTKLNSISKN